MTISELSDKKCVPCEGEGSVLSLDQSRALAEQLGSWDLDENRLVRNLKFKDFAKAMTFANEVGELAEAEGHHPDIFIHDWNQVRLSIWTHSVGGLTENDFILASKIDRLRTF